MSSTIPSLTNFVADHKANIFLTAAKLQGWEVNVIEKEGSVAEIKKGSLTYRICRSILSANDEVAITISSDKYLSHLVLRHHIPFVTHPHQYNIVDLKPKDITPLLNQYHKLVVKPLNFNEGIGVTTSLETVASVMAAVEKIKQLRADRVMIENHLEIVNEYRVILWKGKVIDVLRRIPAYIIGDGHHTIEQLVKEKNQYRLTRFEGLFDPIEMDDDFHTILKKRQLDANAVLEKGHHLKLETTCNLAQGGETERIPTTSIHPHYHAIFQKVFEATHLNYCGVDLISPDITQAPEVDVTAINELNAAPAFTVGYYADLATESPFWGVNAILTAMENDPV